MSKVALLNVTSVAKARQVESITPPNGLSYVEESIARCSRLTRQHVPFLRSSSFGAFVNVSGNELETSIIKFANEHSIAVHNIFSEGLSPLTRNISLFEEYIKSTLELILRLSVDVPVVLIIGSSTHTIDSIIVACLRRVQEWSFVSILGELRMHSGCRQFDVEQFIENFNPDIIDISQNTPDYLLIHMRLKEEEGKLLTRLEEHTYLHSKAGSLNSQNVKRGEQLSESDVILCKLFFSPKLTALSPGTQFDPSISLINDKDDDD